MKTLSESLMDLAGRVRNSEQVADRLSRDRCSRPLAWMSR